MMGSSDISKLRLERLTMVITFLERANLQTFNTESKESIEKMTTEVFKDFVDSHLNTSLQIMELDINSKFKQ